LNKAIPVSKNERYLSATWLVILSGTLYGFLGYFGTQVINQGMAISTMLFWRFFVAMLWMIGFRYFQKDPPKSNKNFLRLTPVLVLSGLFYAGSSVFYFFASKKTGTGLAMVIFFAYPIFIALSVWANNRWRINKGSLLSLLLVITGLVLLQNDHSSPVSFIGLGFALLASLSYALYIYQSKLVINQYSSSEFTILICAISALFFFLVSVSTHHFSAPTTSKSLVNVLAVGILATALPIQLLLDGLKSINILKASILSALEPIVTLILGVLVMHELVSATQIIGVLVIITGTIVIQFARDNE
jgi:drug/metabolite transporter (DMT)-like permease